MRGRDGTKIVARCVVCKGDIYKGDYHELWDGGYYCQRHSLAYLMARAREYQELLAREESEGTRLQ
jgi:hypothetical protein